MYEHATSHIRWEQSSIETENQCDKRNYSVRCSYMHMHKYTHIYVHISIFGLPLFFFFFYFYSTILNCCKHFSTFALIFNCSSRGVLLGLWVEPPAHRLPHTRHSMCAIFYLIFCFCLRRFRTWFGFWLVIINAKLLICEYFKARAALWWS